MRIYKTQLFFITLCFVALANATLLKVSNTRVLLPDEAKEWSCIIDTKSKLMWEVKQNNTFQNSNNTYTWFNGKSGTKNGNYSHHCDWLDNCNTKAFIDTLNAAKLCQASDWRLPNSAELNSLLVYNDNNPLINAVYFPNTQSQLYWSSSEKANNPDVAIATPFFYGGTGANGKSFDAYVRGVRDLK